MRIAFRGHAVLAIVDSGADTTSIDELTASDSGLRYSASGLSSGVGGEVVTFLAEPIAVTILGPRRRGLRIEWVTLGTHTLRLSVLRAPSRLPALVGRTDLLAHYRFVLREAEAEFELTPLKPTE